MWDFIKSVLDIDFFEKIWNDHYDFSVVQVVFLGLLFLAFDVVILTVTWFSQKWAISEAGYPKHNVKYVKKKFKQYPALGKLTLIPLFRDAEKKGFFPILCLFNNFLNIAAAVSCTVGYVGSIVTHADGWAAGLLIGSPLCVLLFTTIISFVPGLIWLPSERRRYSLK